MLNSSTAASLRNAGANFITPGIARRDGAIVDADNWTTGEVAGGLLSLDEHGQWIFVAGGRMTHAEHGAPLPTAAELALL